MICFLLELDWGEEDLLAHIYLDACVGEHVLYTTSDDNVILVDSKCRLLFGLDTLLGV